MRPKSHKTITALLNLLVVVGSFEVLIAILNLNQPVLFIQTAFTVGLFHIFQIFLLYDLHYKSSGALARAKSKHQSVNGRFLRYFKTLFSAFWDRCSHLRRLSFLRQWLHYLLLPGLLFWGSIWLFYLNFGFYKIQQIFVVLSSLALMLNYWYLKEIFYRRSEEVDPDVFVALSVVKIYTGGIIFMASVGLVRHFCLDSYLLSLAVFAFSFLLVYQALFQHRLINLVNVVYALVIAVIMAFVAHLTLVLWGYNYFTAGIFMGAVYNLLWGVYHYHLDRALSWQTFLEIFIISAIVAAMVMGTTNFKARILDSCQYSFSEF